MTNTRKPSFINALCLAICNGRGFLPGAFSSAKAILPCGRSISLSGIPSKFGETNFKHRPPFFLTAYPSFCSICFSRILRSFFFNGGGRRNSFHKTLYKAFFVNETTLKGILYYDLLRPPPFKSLIFDKVRLYADSNDIVAILQLALFKSDSVKSSIEIRGASRVFSSPGAVRAVFLVKLARLLRI